MAAVAQRTTFQKVNPYLPSSKTMKILGVVGVITAGCFGVEYVKGRAFSSVAIGQSAFGVALTAGISYRLNKYLKKSRQDLALLTSRKGEKAFQKKEYAKAIPLLQDAVIAWEKLGSKDLTKLAELKNNLAICFKETDQFQQAVHYFTAAFEAVKGELKIHKTRALKFQAATFLCNLGVAHICAEEGQKAIPCLEEALKLRKSAYGRLLNHPEIAGVLRELGYAHQQVGNKEKAMENLKAARAIYLKINNNEIASRIEADLQGLQS